MDVDYLKKNVGDVLATGLAAVVMNNPPDSVDFLAKWLLNYVDSVKAQDEAKTKLAAQLKQDEQDQMAALAAYEAQMKAVRAAWLLNVALKHQLIEKALWFVCRNKTHRRHCSRNTLTWTHFSTM
jgi:hypothetical protein